MVHLGRYALLCARDRLGDGLHRPLEHWRWFGVGVVLAVWGTLAGPFNGLGWIAVGFNGVLGLGFASAWRGQVTAG